ncbi:penicillin acylase family protein [Verminephrobacter sp. Larva24]|nr:penicillin acylase family protein [Verminephrobacter sp. Larva24]
MTPTTRQLPGLRAPVDLWRDAWGIAHLRARGADDAFFALGHVHASDRLWQMDALRRRTLGRYAEWLGPSALPMDMLARRLGLTECCCRDLLVVNDDTRAMLAAYTAGVNAFIATGPLPPEYALLGATPEPWQDWHCIAVLRQTSLLLNSVYPKLWRAIALPIVGAAALDRLRMNDGSDDLACMPPGASADRIAPDMAALADAMAGRIRHGAGAGETAPAPLGPPCGQRVPANQRRQVLQATIVQSGHARMLGAIAPATTGGTIVRDGTAHTKAQAVLDYLRRHSLVSF